MFLDETFLPPPAPPGFDESVVVLPTVMLPHEVKSDEREFEFWVTLVLDPVQEQLIVAGVAKSEAECRGHFARIDSETACYCRSFELMHRHTGADLQQWFKACGISGRDAREMAQQLGKSLKKQLRGLRRK